MKPVPSLTGLRGRALAYLARREHSRRELETKLSPHAANPHELSDLLDALEQQGLLSAQRMAEAVARNRRSKFGSARIVHELQEKGIAADLIAAVLPQLKESELAAAREVWRKKFGNHPATAAEQGKQMRFMMSRGFSSEIVYKVLRQSEE